MRHRKLCDPFQHGTKVKDSVRHDDPATVVTQGTLVTACLCILAGVALVSALVLAKAILAPIALALVLGIVVSPVVEFLVKKGAPRILLSVAMVWIILGAIFALLLLVEPAFSMVKRILPDIMDTVRMYLASFSDVFAGLEEVNPDSEDPAVIDETTLADQIPSVSQAIWLAPNFGAQFLIFVGTLFFFVLTRNELYAALPQRAETLLRADRAVSSYFAAVSLVNTGLGVATGVVMALIGVEYPIFWGLAAAVLNFFLYLGPICIIGGLLIAGLVQFGGAYAFLPPLAFFALNSIEAQFVTPLIVGQHVRVNPLFVFLSIITGLWIWGPVGAIVALPFVIWIKRIVAPSGS